MGSQGSFLDQILQLKREIDEINVMREVEIRKTMELESELVRASEAEKDATKQLEELVRSFVSRDNHYHDLCVRADAISLSNSALEESITTLKAERDEMKRKADEERDEFIAYCKAFQERQEHTSVPSTPVELQKRLVSLKKEFACEKAKGRDDILQRLRRDHEDLQWQIDKDIMQNKRLLAEIEQLQTALQDVETSRANMGSSKKLEAIEEEKQELEDCVYTLKGRLAEEEQYMK